MVLKLRFFLASRHNAILDRGYAEFQFLYTNTTDTGEYVCVAKTASGTTQSTPCSVMWAFRRLFFILVCLVCQSLHKPSSDKMPK